ncbi:glutathione S-transferase C-terminal domain-containing protein homolog [Uloborus diversus]|uniref:glutathione S-transferase C-terminal domain-containing protein homolog n=1 Tax=Uloborus diversus TaxID=327109 RepID=UPI00240941A2|nr:glutathione S-transferase C-terminal domain-containing protein homolog [Uloborus diversus]
MNATDILYVSGRTKSEDELEITIETLITLFVYHYCDFQLEIIIIDTDDEYLLTISLHSLRNISFHFKSREDALKMGFSCHLPAIHSSKENTFVAGVCAVLRWAIKSHLQFYPDHHCGSLLGFRGGCLVACAESSAWTKFCEVQLPNSVQKASSCSKSGHVLKIPENLLLLEEHLKRPVRTHNILKRKLDIVRKVKKDNASKSAENGPSVEMTEEQSSFTLYGSDSVAVDVDDLSKKIESIVINEKSEEFSLNHSYLEGIDLTLADIIVFPSGLSLIAYENAISLFMKCTILSVVLQRDQLIFLKILHPFARKHLPSVLKWYERLNMKDNVKKAVVKSKFNVLLLNDPCDNDSTISITVPSIDKNSLYKRDPSNTKMKCKHQNPVKILALLQEANIKPTYSFNYCSHLNWKDLPADLHPLNGDLPEKRVNRKCQQIESIVTAVLKVAKQGQKIVEFCAGGGHVGLLLAYFLPSCQVILIENKESSMMRAKNRAEQLNLKNVTFYQCNLDYFKGSFDVGLCLHACGVATDLVLQQCIRNKASFVCCPCCYGGVQNTHLLSYPLSKTFSSLGFSYKEYMLLAHCADRNEINTPTAEQGELCMGLIDTDRVYYAEEHNYEVKLTKLQPAECSPKHNLLIGLSPISI